VCARAGVDASLDRGGPLRARLLGPFRLSLGEASAGPWARPSARRLCELLLITPSGRIGREAASEALFSNLDANAAANALRKALSMARLALSALGEGAAGWLRADRACIWLEPGFDLEVDFEAHRDALQAALSTPSGAERDHHLTIALAEKGLLLEEEPYTEWALPPREALEALRQEARLALARDRAKGFGRCGLPDVIQAWEECFRSEPALEEAAGVLIRTYSAQGRHALAATTYGRCQQALEDLGLRVSPALAELARASNARREPGPARHLVAPGEEHRVVSVLFVCLSWAVGANEELGPEDLRDLISGALADVMAQVEALAGTVTAVTGAGLVAVFGAPESHEDDPERALRAALHCVRNACSYSDGLSLRIGVETGHAVVGPIGAGPGAHYDAVGEVSLIAAALQSAAKPTSVLVGPATRRAVHGIFDWGATQEVPIPPGGITVVAGYLESSKARPAGEVARRRLAGAAPLLGRDVEVSVLREALEQTITGKGVVLVVMGEPGLGKTRLVQECRKLFMTWVGAASGRLPLWLEGRAASYGANTPYGVYQRLMFSWAGTSQEENDGTGLASLERAVKAIFPGPLDRRRLALLAQVMGLKVGPEGHELTLLGAEALQRACFSAVEDIFARLMVYGPTLLVLEDLHWADATSLRLTEALCRLTQKGALLVVLTRRPEPDPGTTGLEAALSAELGDKLSKLELAPLPEEPSRALVRALLGDGAQDEIVKSVADGAEGNPLFLEERLASLLERRALVRDETGGWRLDLSAPGQVPEALERLVRSRVDRLPAAQREAITAASVLGQEFSVGALANVSDLGADVARAVYALRASGLVVEVDGRYEPVYRFRHSLIQDAIYTGLLRHQRRGLHARAAWGLEASSAGRFEEGAALLGHHFAMAGEVERAGHYLELAGDHAASVFANDEAVASYLRALEVLGAAPGEMVIKAVELWLKLGTLFWRLGRYGEGRAALQEAAGLVPTGCGLLAAKCYRWIGQIEIEDARDEEAVMALDIANSVLDALPDKSSDEWVEAWLDVQFSRSNLHYWRNEGQLQVAVLARLRPLVEARAGARQKAEFRVHVTGQRWRADRFGVDGEMVAEIRSARSQFAETGENPENYHWQTLGFLLLLQGQLAQAETELHGALAAARRAGDKSLELFCLIFLGWARLRQKDVAETKARALESLELMRAHAFLVSAMPMALLCWAAWKEGAFDEAERLGVEALQQWQPLIVRYPFCWITVLPLVAVRLANERYHEAIEAARGLLEPPQMRLPPRLEAALVRSISAWDSGQPRLAADYLGRALRLAEELNFL
jgi:class 3 adenylate cyclase/tetratricopeptide (TPR) repeat protein